MDQKIGIVLVLAFVMVVMGSIVVYDFIKNDRLKQITGQKERKNNWNWNDNWNDSGNPVQPINPTQPAQPIGQQIVASDYDDALQKSGQLGKPIFVYFEADWCSWCKKMKSETLSDSQVRSIMRNYILVYVNLDQNRNIANRFSVQSIPAYVVTNYRQDGLKSDKGYKGVAEFSAWLNDPSLFNQPKAPVGGGATPPPPSKPERPTPPTRPGGG